jgi:hypothetical protein
MSDKKWSYGRETCSAERAIAVSVVTTQSRVRPATAETVAVPDQRDEETSMTTTQKKANDIIELTGAALNVVAGGAKGDCPQAPEAPQAAGDAQKGRGK